MKFSYKTIELPPGERREFLLRPIIPIYLFYRKSFLHMEALLDSGADFCIFHKEIADALGVNWKQGAPHHFIGITGEKGIMYFHHLKIKVGSWMRSIPCAFSENLSEESYGILGQEGFFENFKISFDCGKEIIDIKAKKMR